MADSDEDTLINVKKPEIPDFNTLEIQDSIEEFFTKDELNQMCDYDKQRYKNVRKNYEMMVQVGLPAIKPEFMRNRRKRQQLSAENKNLFTGESDDDEWIPRSKPRLGEKACCPAFQLDRKHFKKKEIQQKTKIKRNEKVKVKEEDKEEEEVHIYPFRKRKDTNYTHLEIPDDDHFLYCEECNMEHEGDCPVHGPLLEVFDIPVPKDGTDSDRALHTLPKGLEVRESGIPNAGLGVWTTKFYPVRSRFGPYEGKLIVDPAVAHASGYCWQICRDGKPTHFVDAENKSVANWMRYVNCARHVSEQNVTAYQYCGQIYYRAHCDIKPGTELLVWYGAEYGHELGVKREAVCQSAGRLGPADGVYPCPHCHLAFAENSFLERHIHRIHACHNLSGFSYHRQTHNTPIMYPPRQTKTSFSDLPSKQYRDQSHCVDICSSSQENLLLQKTCKIKECVNFRKQLVRSKHSLKLNNNLIKDEISENRNLNYGGNDECTGQAQTNVQVKDECLSPDRSKRTRSGKLYFKPDQQEAFFSHISNTAKHKRTRLRERLYKCEQRLAVFTQSDQLPEHKKTHHTAEDPYKYKRSDTAFTLSSNLEKHKRTHTGKRPYKCQQCGAAFTQSNNLEKHKRTHTGERPYKCQQCGAAFTQSNNLENHKRTHTGERPYKCQQCGAAFTQSSHLENHKRTHTGERPYKCQQCGAAFTRSSHLETHKRTHTGERPYKCQQCGAAFTVSSSLETHKRTHTGERPYKCQQCGAAFTRSSHLETHKRTHTGERPYKCQQCGAAFTESGHLKNHKRTHTGERPYKCQQCGAAFTQSNNLENHKRTHTGERPYKCQQCGAAFTQSGHLAKHKKTKNH